MLMRAALQTMLRRVGAFASPLFLASMSGVSSAAIAQSASAPPQARPPASGDTIRLTDDEREAVLNRNTMESAAAARGELAGSERAPLEVHGEVGAVIGSNGTRGVYGTAAVPLGDHAGAVVSFESEQFGRRR